ncbi:IS3 family transposase [Streptomyces sp. NPDC048142]|uniref:IS3 family transposase n=1 Tax=Streptomyces sp. NPDC048142 TaxID=3365501 RepID=UPI00371AAC5D
MITKPVPAPLSAPTSRYPNTSAHPRNLKPPWFKTELIKPQRPWKTLSQVELATVEWVDWYCHRRLHGEIGHVPPAEYETNYYLTTTKPQVTTPN